MKTYIFSQINYGIRYVKYLLILSTIVRFFFLKLFFCFREKKELVLVYKDLLFASRMNT